MRYWLQILTAPGISALGACPSFLRSQSSPFLTETSFVALQESSSTEGSFVVVWLFQSKEKKKYSDGFFFWKPPRKFGELWAFLFLLTPSILLPASSLQKELRDHRALLVASLPCSGGKSCYKSDRQWMHFSCLLGWMGARNWGNHLQMRQLCESWEERSVQHFSGGFLPAVERELST